MCEDVFGPILDNKGIRSSRLSLLQYSFNLDIAIKKLISIEMTQITTEHELHFRMPLTDTRSNVLLSQSIQRKSDIVMKSNSENKINKCNLHYYSNSPPLSSSSSSLSNLTVGDVERLLESIEFNEYKAVFVTNKIDGKCLMECNTVEDVVNMGISIFVKARIFLNEVMTWKASGVPMEYFSVDQREDNDAKDMIDEVKVNNHNYRKTKDDDVDSEVMQGEAGTNGNDHEDSVLDDTSCKVS
jgi:hypothetical protein